MDYKLFLLAVLLFRLDGCVPLLLLLLMLTMMISIKSYKYDVQRYKHVGSCQNNLM